MAIPGEPETFHGALTRLTAGELELMSVNSSPLVTRSSARDTSDDSRFSLHLVHSGRCRLWLGGTDFSAETGDMIVVDSRKPYDLAFERPVHGLVLTLPWGRFGGHADALESRAGRPIDLGAGPAAVLSGFVRSAWDELVERDGEDWPESASAVIWDLLTSILQSEPRRRAQRQSCRPICAAGPPR